MMVPPSKSKTLITDLYSMNPPDSRGYYFFTTLSFCLLGWNGIEKDELFDVKSDFRSDSLDCGLHDRPKEPANYGSIFFSSAFEN
jgi:hypothetical protein